MMQNHQIRGSNEVESHGRFQASAIPWPIKRNISESDILGVPCLKGLKKNT